MKEMYGETADPHFNNEDGYWPLKKSMNHLFYQTLPLFTKNNHIIPIQEVMYGFDEIKVNDSPLSLGWSAKSLQFTNVKSSRTIQDKSANYIVLSYKSEEGNCMATDGVVTEENEHWKYVLND